MKYNLKSSCFLIAAFSLALPWAVSQQPLQQPPAQDTRSEPRPLRLIDLHVRLH